jgi:hypothetical protein
MMKAVELNFSKQLARKQRKRDWIVLALSVLLIVFMSREAMMLEKQQANESQAQRTQQKIQQPILIIDPEQQKLAQTMVDRLNVPWYELLAALESVTQGHPDVFLQSVLPDARKNEVIISGEVKRLEILLPYVDSLNQHKLFSYALPMQQQLVPVSNGMAFTLKVGWRQ